MISYLASAQVPNQISGINYQGIAREADGTPIADNTIDVAISILDNGGNTIFSETHSGVLTNQFGLFTLIIGTVNTLDANLWNQAIKIKTEADFGSGMVEIGTVVLAAVPYAFKAKYEGQKIEYSSSNNRLYITNGNGTYLDSVTIASGGSSLPAGGTNGQVLSTDGNGNYAWITDNDSDPANEIQNLELDGDSTIILKEGNGNINSTIHLPNDNQRLNLSGTIISIENGNNIDLGSIIPAGGTDDQNLDSAVLSGTSLSIHIEGGNAASVDLSSLQDGTGTDNQDLELTGNNLTLTNDGTSVDLSGYLDNTDAQTLSLSGNTLTISNGNNVTLTDNVNDADANPTNEIQTLTLSGNTLEISGGNTVTLPSGSDNQDLELSGNNLTLTNDVTPVDLSGYLDNTDAQTLSLSGNTLTISNGNNVTLTDNVNDADADPNNEIELPTGGTNGQLLSTDGSGNYSWISDNIGSDDQAISGSGLSGTTLTIGIEGGSNETVDLSSLAEADDDWFLGGSTTAKPTSINDDIWKRGNVGIFGAVGSNTISHMLTIGQTSSTTTPMVAIKNGHATGDASMLFDGGTTDYSIGSDAGNGSFTIAQNSSGLGTNDRLVIQNNSGYVGIGTSSPGAKLDIKTNSATTDALYIGQSTTLPQLVVKAGGNVGIGTTSPSSKLAIENSANAHIDLTSTSGNAKINLQSSSGNSSINFYESGTSQAEIGWNSASNYLYLNDGTANSLTSRSGRVGVGTNFPSEKLHIVNNNENISLKVENSYASGNIYGIQNRITSSTTNNNATYATWNGVNNVNNSNTLATSTFANYSFTNNGGTGTSYGYYYRDYSGTNTSYGIYTQGEDRNYLSGRIGLGVTSPSYQLHLSSNSAAKPTSSAWTVTSDKRLKENILPYKSGIDDIMKINPVWYTYNGKAGLPRETGIGVIAQDLQKIAPYMVNEWTYQNKETYLGVDNGAMTYMLINATKQQQEVILSMEEQLKVQQKQINALIKEIENLKK
ncbi:MAG: tail fiber domain-containing protein [Flavobacteriales bacterium]|nr:tail fiber domain-containing protein [Flavobacteriales bacterium]